MAHLYANENYPFAVVNELRRLGHDVITTQDIGNAGRSIPDDQVLQTAIHDSIALAQRIHEKLNAVGELKGQLIRITRPQS